MDRLTTRQFLTFLLGSEIYALEVGCTREVLEYVAITPIPRMPEWIRGVINLRGTVVPVLDLKHKLGMGQTERSKKSCILILEIPLEGERSVVGVLADAVQEVLEIATTEIEPPPRFGARVSTTYLRGMGRRGDNLFIVLDVDKIFASSELELVGDAASAIPDPKTIHTQEQLADGFATS